MKITSYLKTKIMIINNFKNMNKYSYAAPEIIAGKEYFGPLADIWSIGVILFALVCGYLPFEDSNTADLYKKILSGEYNISFFLFYHLMYIKKKLYIKMF